VAYKLVEIIYDVLKTVMFKIREENFNSAEKYDKKHISISCILSHRVIILVSKIPICVEHIKISINSK